MSIQEVKDRLPPVRVRLQTGDVVIGQLSGRKEKFARIFVGHSGVSFSYEFSWHTVAKAVSNNSILLG